jgi:eukaryotic-like serine/threonine-protein kinase
MKRERMAWLAAVMLLSVGLFAAYYRRPARVNLPTWSYILPSEKTAFSNFSGPAAVSPDGQKLAFVARTVEGMDLLWVRPLDAPNAQSIAGTEGAFYPFWSPDNQFLGFFSGGKLKTVAASGGPVLTLCDATSIRLEELDGFIRECVSLCLVRKISLKSRATYKSLSASVVSAFLQAA